VFPKQLLAGSLQSEREGIAQGGPGGDIEQINPQMDAPELSTRRNPSNRDAPSPAVL
jgi:hypothetical protein